MYNCDFCSIFAAFFEKSMRFAATIGFFDGVHVGHQYLLAALRRVASERGLKSAVLTLDVHPQAVLAGVAQQLLTTVDERTELLKQNGIDEVFLFRFDVIRQMTALEFMRLIHERCAVDTLLMGYDHRFGSDRLTSFADYEAFAKQVGIELVAVSETPDIEVSSSKIRTALLAGDIEQANAMLGYPYSLTGTVVRGNGIGHTMGFPTANIEPDACKLVPKVGVYAAEGALVNIGTNPTVGNERVTIEAYLPDYKGRDFYGQTLTLRFTKRIRDEKKFASLDELKAQIQKDLSNLLCE